MTDLPASIARLRAAVELAKKATPGPWTVVIDRVGQDYPTDTLDDLFPGTGAITDAWNEWRHQYAEKTEAA